MPSWPTPFWRLSTLLNFLFAGILYYYFKQAARVLSLMCGSCDYDDLGYVGSILGGKGYF